VKVYVVTTYREDPLMLHVEAVLTGELAALDMLDDLDIKHRSVSTPHIFSVFEVQLDDATDIAELVGERRLPLRRHLDSQPPNQVSDE
jgi:hypothetical protein